MEQQINNDVLRLAKLSGYSRLPLKVGELLNNDYYLKSIGDVLYPFWKDRLRELYPTEITSSYVYVATSGTPPSAGKSFYGLTIMLIDMIRLMTLDNPFEFLGFSPTTPLSFCFVNTTKERAENTLIAQFKELMNQCPFIVDQIKSNKGNLPHNIKLVPVAHEKDLISHNVVGCVFSEVNNFKRDEVAEKILSEILTRLEGRMRFNSYHMFTHLILDSSESLENSPINNFLKNPYYRSLTQVVKGSMWEVKGHTGNFFNLDPKSFYCYIGDSKNPIMIVDKKEDFDSHEGLDPEKIFEIPSEYRGFFNSDPEKSIKDLLGQPLSSNSLFFQNKERTLKSFIIEKKYNDVIDDISMFDNEKLIDKVYDDILNIPIHRKVVVSIDLGITKDKCGISIGYCDRFEYDSTNKSSKGFYQIPISFALSRLKGEETSITKIIEFLLDLNEIREIQMVTCDTYQSRVIQQQMMINDIPCQSVSVDRDDSCYNVFKMLIYSNQLLLPKNELLQFEILNLKRIEKNKIEHDKDKSKDVADATCACSFTLSQLGLETSELSTQSKIDNYRMIIKQNNEMIKTRRLRRGNRF